MDCGYLLMALGESNFLALATAESSVYVEGTKKSAPKPCHHYPIPASNDAAKSIPSLESRKQVNVSRIPNLEPATCPFVFHLPLRPSYPSIRFEMNDSSHERASCLYSRGCVLFE